MKYFPPIFAAAVLLLMAAVAGAVYGAAQPRVIPNAAAFEANLVCTQFNWLASFTVQHTGTTDETQQYRITATCTSGHTVTNTIGVK